jgi:hypothetical protein
MIRVDAVAVCLYKWMDLSHCYMFKEGIEVETATQNVYCARILEQSMGAKNRVGIGLSYRLDKLAELIPWIRFLGSLKVL